jgi:hypothetical protein
MAILKMEPVFPIQLTERTSPWSPFCLRVEEWAGGQGEPLTLSPIQGNL